MQRTTQTLARMEPLGRLHAEPGNGRTTYCTAHQRGDGWRYEIAPGTLAATRWITADFLLEGPHALHLRLGFSESEARDTRYGKVGKGEKRPV